MGPLSVFQTQCSSFVDYTGWFRTGFPVHRWYSPRERAVLGFQVRITTINGLFERKVYRGNQFWDPMITSPSELYNPINHILNYFQLISPVFKKIYLQFLWFQVTYHSWKHPLFLQDDIYLFGCLDPPKKTSIDHIIGILATVYKPPLMDWWLSNNMGNWPKLGPWHAHRQR